MMLSSYFWRLFSSPCSGFSSRIQLMSFCVRWLTIGGIEHGGRQKVINADATKIFGGTIRIGGGVMIGRIGSTKNNGRSNVGTTAQANWKMSASRWNFAHLCARPWWCLCRSALIIVSYHRKLINHSGRRYAQWCQPDKKFIITIWARTQVFLIYLFGAMYLPRCFFFLFFFL